MNAFAIYASGDDFDVDSFLASSSLVPTRVSRRGELLGGSNSTNSRYANSSLAVELGNGRAVSIPEQESVAIVFLQQHRQELRSLAQFPGVTSLRLGLQYHTVAERNLRGFAMYTSSSLMWHLLDVGCELSHFVSVDYSDAEDSA
jgi:hypothetical protein